MGLHRRGSFTVRPIIEDATVSLEVRTVPLYRRDPVSGLVLRARARSAVGIPRSGGFKQTVVSGVVFGGAVAEEVVAVGRAFLAGVDDRIIRITVAEVAADAEGGFVRLG
jgi:hypothetical protein